MTLTATFIAVDRNQQLFFEPCSQDVKTASSLHVFAFSSNRDLLVVESEGEFGIEIWQEVYQKAKLICLGLESDYSESEDTSIDSNNDAKLEDLMKNVVRGKMVVENKWKGNSI